VRDLKTNFLTQRRQGAKRETEFFGAQRKDNLIAPAAREDEPQFPLRLCGFA